MFFDSLHTNNNIFLRNIKICYPFSEQSNLKSQIMTVWMWEFREILNTKLQKTPTSLRKQTVTWIESFIYLFIYLFFPKS